MVPTSPAPSSANEPGYNAFTDSFNINVFKINDIGGDPAYRVEIFELKSESYFLGGGGNPFGGDDNQAIARFSRTRVDAPFSVIGLPASATS